MNMAEGMGFEPTETVFVCRLLHQQEFPRQLIREELVSYKALLRANGRPRKRMHERRVLRGAIESLPRLGR